MNFVLNWKHSPKRKLSGTQISQARWMCLESLFWTLSPVAPTETNHISKIVKLLPRKVLTISHCHIFQSFDSHVYRPSCSLLANVQEGLSSRQFFISFHFDISVSWLLYNIITAYCFLTHSTQETIQEWAWTRILYSMLSFLKVLVPICL